MFHGTVLLVVIIQTLLLQQKWLVGKGLTLTAVNGNPAVSSVNPDFTRDFTSGTEFKGVTTFDTQGYFVPPSGTTELRETCGKWSAFARGLFGGGNTPTKFNIDRYIYHVQPQEMQRLW